MRCSTNACAAKIAITSPAWLHADDSMTFFFCDIRTYSRRKCPLKLAYRIFVGETCDFRCQKRTWKRLHPMSALPPKADIGTRSRNVRFVPILLQKSAVMDSW